MTNECVMKLFDSSRWKFYPGNCRSTPVAIATTGRVTDTSELAGKEFAIGKLQPNEP